MKKYLFGAIAMVLATASVAFTRPTEHRVFTDYYFPVNPSTGVLQSYIKADNMAYTTPQLGCTGTGAKCEEANTAFTATPVSGGFQISPSGSDEPATLKKHN